MYQPGDSFVKDFCTRSSSGVAQADAQPTAAMVRNGVNDPAVSLTVKNVVMTTITGAPAGGTFTITVNTHTTAGLAYNAAASAVQTAIQGLSGIGAGNAIVTGNAGGPYQITFAATIGSPAVSASGASLTGGTSPAAVVLPGRYTLSGAVPGGYSYGDEVELIVVAAVGGVTDQFPIDLGILRQLPTFTGSNVNAVGFSTITGTTAAGNTAPVNADFEVSSGLYWSQTILATGLDSTGWTQMVFTLKTSPATDSDDEALLTVRLTATAVITNKALTTNVATLTAAAHPFTVGEVIVVAGVDATFNGTVTITAVTSTTFSYAVTHADVGSTAASGTANLTTDGLLVYKGIAATTATNASVSVGSASPNTSVTWAIQAAAMDLPDSGNIDYTWEVTRWIGQRKEQIGTGDVSMSRGARRSPAAP